MSVYPVIAELIRPRPLDPATLSAAEDEVAEVFTVPIESLVDAKSCKYTQFRVKTGPGYTLPMFDVQPHR